MASIDFDPEDYIDEISTNDLIKELECRANKGDEPAKAYLSKRDGGYPVRYYTREDLIEAIQAGDRTHLNIVIEGLRIEA